MNVKTLNRIGVVFLTAHLISFYFVIFNNKIKYGEWPLYSSKVPSNSTNQITSVVIGLSLTLYIIISIFTVLIFFTKNQYRKAILCLSLLLAIFVFHLYLNPFFEWYAD